MKLSTERVELEPEDVERIARRVVEIQSSRAEPWIGVQEAAEHLACKRHRVYNLVHQGRIEYRKDGARLLFRRSDLDRYLAGSGE
jgi:excisionase family DNA binding protein